MNATNLSIFSKSKSLFIEKRGEFMKKIYVTDLDGTLFDSNAEITLFTQNILKEFLQNNKLTFFTARSYYVARKKLGDIPFNVPCAVLNGCYIVDYLTGEIYIKNIIELKTAKEIIELALQNNIYPILICQYKGQEKMLYGDYYNNGYREYIMQRKKNNDKRLQKFDFHFHLDFLDDTDCLTLQFIDSREKLSTLKDVTEKYDINSYLGKELYCSDSYYLNITPLKATKESSLEIIAHLQGMNLKDFVVFGDQENDIEMFKVAGESCAVDNAIPELKQLATRVIDSNLDDGVAKYLQRVMIQENL